jgi:hypothetical protein
MAHFLASWGSLDICHRDSGYSAVLLQVAPTDRIRDTTQKTDVRRPKHPCTFLRVFVRRIWEAWLEICLRPAGSNEARLIMSDVKSVLSCCTATQTFCGKRASELGLDCQSSTCQIGRPILVFSACRRGPWVLARLELKKRQLLKELADWDINNRGQVVGGYHKKDGVVHGFLLAEGEVHFGRYPRCSFHQRIWN